MRAKMARARSHHNPHVATAVNTGPHADAAEPEIKAEVPIMTLSKSVDGTFSLQPKPRNFMPEVKAEETPINKPDSDDDLDAYSRAAIVAMGSRESKKKEAAKGRAAILRAAKGVSSTDESPTVANNTKGTSIIAKGRGKGRGRGRGKGRGKCTLSAPVVANVNKDTKLKKETIMKKPSSAMKAEPNVKAEFTIVDRKSIMKHMPSYDC